MDKAIHYINNVLDFINSVPGHQWYIFGLVVASLPVTAGLVELYKRHHFKVNATELTNHAIDFTVAVTATLMTTADFVLANGTNLSHFLPFLVTVMPTITAFAPHVFDVSKAVHSWLINRQTEDQKQRFSAVLQAADGVIGTQPVAPASSFGTESAGKTNLIQL